MKSEQKDSDFKSGCKSTMRILFFSFLWWVVFFVWLSTLDLDNSTTLENVLVIVLFLFSLFSPMIIYCTEKRIVNFIHHRKTPKATSYSTDHASLDDNVIPFKETDVSDIKNQYQAISPYIKQSKAASGSFDESDVKKQPVEEASSINRQFEDSIIDNASPSDAKIQKIGLNDGETDNKNLNCQMNDQINTNIMDTSVSHNDNKNSQAALYDNNESNKENSQVEQSEIELPITGDTPSNESNIAEYAYLNDYKYEYEIYTDPFTQEREIQWYKIDSYANHADRTKEDFGCPLSINAYENNGVIRLFYSTGLLHFHLRIKAPQLGIRYNSKETFKAHKLSKGDALSFLFDDGSIIKYVLRKAPNGVLRKDDKEIRFELTNNDVQKFTTQLVTKYRLDCANGDASQVVEVKYKDRSQIVQHHFRVYMGVLDECGERLCDLKESEVEETTNNKGNESCFVYLMYDESNGYYKIGISNNPKYREHTLQSEKPTIVLVQAKEFPIRTIAEAFEAALHKTYESKRLRGEWFSLDIDDVANLKKTLQ